MKKGKYILTLLAAAILSACTDYDVDHLFTVGEADNAITLRAGVAEGGSGVMTRGAEDHHGPDATYGGGHKAFSTTNPTQLRLRVDGTWRKSGSSTTNISYATTAKTGSETGTDSKHNELTFSPTLYWDDYGTADPENMSLKDASDNELHTGNGRDKGLTIYGVAVNEKNLPTETTGGRAALSTLTTSDDWQNIEWNVGTASSNVVDQTSGWDNYDLLISNNIKEGNDGTLKFDDLYPTKKSTASDLLEFTHAMSKITVRLIAGEGFPTTGVGGTPNKFTAAPEVVLTSNEGTATTNTEWPYTSGTINVETKAVTSQASSAKVSMHQGTVPSTDVNTFTVIYDALVMPGSEFKNKGTTEEPYPTIARIKADGNIYYITSEKIRAKMKELNAYTDYKTESGKNYIITATINKTKIEVTATITDWVDVEAETVTPTINVSGQAGDKGATNGSLTAFDFYMREKSETNYTYRAKASGIADGESKYQFKDASDHDISLYWPTHDTHYHMRGVAPTNTTITDGKIAVSNAAYSSATYPSNLMIGAPEIAEDDKMCNNSDHTSVNMIENGICARNKTINLNFRYMMSQVEVKLQTMTGDAAVNIGENTTVEIVNVANSGNVKLGDREVVPNTQNQTYTLNPVSTTDLTGEALAKAQCTRRSVIVPQTFIQGDADASTNTRFKVTITNDDGSKDIYYADVEPILNTAQTDKVAPNGKWESGVHYVYTLTLSKTEIKVTATLTDWVTVEADQPIWF